MKRIASLGVAGFMVLVQPAPKWRLVEEWRVGGEVEGPHSLTDIRGLGMLPDGHLVILDYKDQQLHILDARGQLVRTVGRKGEGPSEFSEANGLAVAPNGNILVNDPGNNRLTLLNPTGDLLKSVPITNPWGFGAYWDGGYNSRGQLDEYVSVRKPGVRESIGARRIWSADFAKIDTLFAPTCPNEPLWNAADYSYSFQSSQGGMTMSIPFKSPGRSILHAPDESMWKSRIPAYASIVHIPNGKCDADVTIPLREAPVPIPAVVRDSSVQRAKASAAKYGATADLERIPRVYPSFESLMLARNGQLWVQRRNDATHKRFEVFDAAGKLMATLDSPLALQIFRPMIITGDKVIGMVTDEDGLAYLVEWKIVR